MNLTTNKTTMITTGGETFRMVSGFLQGVVSDRYNLKLISKHQRKDGSFKAYVIDRNWNESDILKNISFLKQKNFDGLNVYIRPVDSRFILLDDLSRNTLESLAEIKPCLLMETSPGNFQAWVKLEKIPVDRSELINVCQSLAVKFNADFNSAKPDQIGRLPGFLNMKPKYSPYFPTVKLHKFEDRFSTWEYDNTLPPPVVKIANTLTRKSGRDRSAFDFAVMCSLIEKSWTDEKIKDYLLQRSDKAKERGEPYLNTTLLKAHKRVGI